VIVRTLLLLSLLLMPLAAAPASTLLNDQEERDPESWHRGPVRYIINAKERAFFRDLETDEERFAFIERFWLRRDPNPETAVNEYRLTFWERVVEANWRYTDSAYPGWKTDRGRIFILLGAPDEVQDHPEFDARKDDIAGRGLLRWHYKNLPVSRSLDPVTVVAFLRDNTGEYRLTTDPELNDIYFDPLRPYDRPYLRDLQENMPLVARSELATAMDLGRLQAIPSEEQALHIVLTREFYGTIPAEVAVHRFPAGPSRLYVVLTIILHKDQLTPVFRGDARELDERFRLAARMTTSAGQEHMFGESDFTVVPDPDPADPTVHFQARRLIEPGTYNLVLAAFDEEGNRAATVREDLVILPADAASPGVSDLMLASRFRDHVAGDEAPYVFGDLEVIPRDGRPLTSGDRLRVYFQVTAPPAGSETVSLSYRFERSAGAGEAFEPIGKPRQVEEPIGVQTWDVPLATFPPGVYRIVVEASAGQAMTVRTLDFEVSG
jgi:GWxTD domain-containing protein